MLINAIRFRSSSDAPWQAWRFQAGSGRFRSYTCFHAEPELLHRVAAALNFVFGAHPAGPAARQIAEASVHIADDAGDTWLVHRGPEKTRYLRNGEPVPNETAPAALLAAVLDVDARSEELTGKFPELACFEIHSSDEGLRRNVYGAPPSATQTLRKVITAQMDEIAREAAKLFSLEELASPQLLSQLARQLEPVMQQYREVCRQYTELKVEDDGALSHTDDAARVAQLKSEIALMEQIRAVAQPLLQPGASQKNMKDELQAVEAEIADLQHLNRIGEQLEPGSNVDFAAALEALARVEVYSKVVRALERTRKYCEQKIEPVLRRYGEAAEQGVQATAHIALELESCLASLALRTKVVHPNLGAHESAHAHAGDQSIGQAYGTVHERVSAGLKNWFERFKSRGGADAQYTPNLTVHEEDSAPGANDLETSRLAVEYAATRLAELQGELAHAREQQVSPIAMIDAAHEELVQALSRHKETWSQVARALNLSPEMDVAKLLQVLRSYGRLLALGERRRALQDKLRNHGSELTHLERLVIDWRKTTGSQKLSDLSNPAILLSEARDILRYQEARKNRLAQIQQRSQEEIAIASLRGMLRDRRQKLQTAWKDAFAQHGLVPFPLHDENVPELFRRANLLRGLALVHGTADGGKPTPLFHASAMTGVMSVFVWGDASLDNKLRLEFLHQIEASEASRPTLLLVGDEALAGMLTSIGLGSATVIQSAAPPPRETKPKDTTALGLKPSTPYVTPTPTLPRAAPKRVVKDATITRASDAQSDQINERARRALELLASKRTW